MLFPPGTPGPVATTEVSAACGSTTAYYPDIGVAVITSADPTFGDHVGRDRAYSAASEALRGQNAQAVSLTGAGHPRRGWAQIHTFGARVATADRTGEQWNMSLIRAPQARAIEPGSRDVVVGVLDSGVDATHPDLIPALDPARSAGCLSGRADHSPSAWAPTSSVHGTHVAGLIAAADDGRGITGVAPGVRIAAVKVVDDEGFIYPEYAVCGFMWAAQQRMRITNSSFSVDPWLFTCADEPGQAVAHEAVRRAVQHATWAGVFHVAAVGNQGMDLANPVWDVRSPDNTAVPLPRPVDDDCDVLPAELTGVTAVSAVGAQRSRSSYSSYGSDVVDVTGPGGDPAQLPEGSSSGCVLSTIPDGYGYACGTSMAAPHVAGVAALLASSHPDAGPEQLATLLADGADPLPCPTGENPGPSVTSASMGRSGGVECTGNVGHGFYGHGLVDALDAVSAPDPIRALDPLSR
ncbi:MAG: S8 family serine peptidase [Actinomycetota bacterium]|nr:S8 family serine peptidase [Actinomycetota bacterium]